MNKNIFFGLGIVVILAAGFMSGYYLHSKEENAASVKLTKVYQMLNEPSNVAAGNITKIAGNTISIERTDSLNGVTTRHDVIVADNTVIQKEEFMTGAERQDALKAYQAALAAVAVGDTVPRLSLLKKTNVKIGDLKVGDFIDATAAAAIGDAATVQATSIIVEPPHPQ